MENSELAKASVNNSIKDGFSSRKNLIILLAISFGTIIIWQIPVVGRFILYPFTILGTWFHEMGHGLMALCLGGNFERLEIFADGSGLAYFSGQLFFGSIGTALVAAGGPLGPPIAGSLLIIASKNEKASKFALFSLAFIMLVSMVIWLRSWIGILVILLITAGILLIAIKSSIKWQKLTLQFLGIQAFASAYQSIGYLFSGGGAIEGTSYISDTGKIAENLFLPHWFWAVLLLAFSIFIIVQSIRFAYINKASASKNSELNSMNSKENNMFNI